MQIRITDLPIEGRQIEDTISLEALNERMNLASGNDILFLKEPQVSFHIKPAPGGAVIKGSIQTAYQQPCARCLDTIDEPLTVELELVCKEAKDDDESSESIADSNAGVVHFEGDYVDLEECLQELLILKLSPFKSPACNADGDCSLCGLNFEREYGNRDEAPVEGSSTMGSLLEAALNKKKTQH